MLKYLSPYNFMNFSSKILPFSAFVSIIFFVIAIYLSFFNSPPDYQQGDMVRMMYIHVPSAWMALFIYLFIALCSISSIVWKTTLSYFLAVSAAPIGCLFALITLVTGSLWGKPMWGTWWVWDARLTSMFVLFLLYISYIVIVNSADNIMRSEKPASVVALIGTVNIPIVKFSVDIWNSLHQPASILRIGGPTIDGQMIQPLITMFLSCIFYFITILIIRTRKLISNLRRENDFCSN